MSAAAPKPGGDARQLTFDLPLRPATGVEDFLVAPSNAEAVAWLDRWPEWPGPALVLWGPTGCGKSHLVQVWRGRSGAALVAGDGLVDLDVGACVDANPAVAVDDADRVAGDPAAERALLHLHNAVAQAGGSLLLTAAAPPARWTTGLADLDSRLRAAPAAAIADPDDRLLAAVLVKQLADRQLEVGADLVDYLVARMERSFAAARALVARLDRLSLAERRRITRPLAARALAGEADSDRDIEPPTHRNEG